MVEGTNPVQQVANQIPSREDVLNKLPGTSTNVKLLLGAVGLLIVIVGVGLGWKLSGKGGGLLGSSQVAPGAKSGPSEAGLSDSAAFPDTATGELKEGGIAGEGTHHLVRPGGDSQNVYLTSTVIDLASFTGKKVQVWGQTIKGRKAGWLMDVGKIKVVQ